MMRGREDDIVFHGMLLCYCDDGRHGKRDDQYCDIVIFWRWAAR